MDTKKGAGRKYAGSAAVTAAVILFMGGFIALLIWALTTDLPPRPILLWCGVCIAGGAAVVGGVLYCFKQRIKEIKGGEEDEARKY